MRRLIAKRPVLYMGRLYDTGDTLPTVDAPMVSAWLRAKSGEWVKVQEKTQETELRPAKKREGAHSNGRP